MELSEITEKSSHMPWELDAEHLFNSIDIDSDGKLTKDELCNHMREKGIGTREARILFDLLDASGDGEVSPDEWAKGFDTFAELMRKESEAAIKLQAWQRGVRGRQAASARAAYKKFRSASGFRSKSLTVEQILLVEPKYGKTFSSRLQWYRWRSVKLMEERYIKFCFLFLVVFNSILIGFQADDTSIPSGTWDAVEASFVFLFSIEIAVKVFGLGRHFVVDNWNTFDAVVVGISLLDLLVRAASDDKSSGSAVSVLRMLRVLRILRVISFSERLNLLVTAWLLALNSVVWVVVLVLLMIYIFAILTKGIIGDDDFFTGDPTCSAEAENYRNIAVAAVTLLQFMTSDNWMEISRSLGECSSWVWMILLPWTGLSFVGLLNLLTAIFIDSLTEISEEAEHTRLLVLEDKRYTVMKHIAESFTKFDGDSSACLEHDELEAMLLAIEHRMAGELQALGIDLKAIRMVLFSADTNRDNQVDFEEFLHSLSHIDSSTVKKDTWKLEARLRKFENRQQKEQKRFKKQVHEVQMSITAALSRIENEYYVWLSKVVVPKIRQIDALRAGRKTTISSAIAPQHTQPGQLPSIVIPWHSHTSPSTSPNANGDLPALRSRSCPM